MNMAYRRVSTLLFATAFVCAGVAIADVAGWLNRIGLSAHATVLEVGEIPAAGSVPVRFKLRNRTGRPVRLVGANEP